MIIADLYPTLYTIDSGLTPPVTDYDTEITDGIMSLTPQGDYITNAYFLFYVEWDDIPSIFKGCVIELTTSSVESRITTEPQNVAGTYAPYYYTSNIATNVFRSQFDYSYSEGTMHNNANLGSIREYYNNFSIRKSGMIDSGQNGLTIFVRDNTTNLWGFAESKIATGYLDFLLGNSNVTFTISGWYGGAQPGSVTFTDVSVNSFGDGYYITEDREIGEKTYTFVICITAYYFTVNRDRNYSNALTNRSYPYPMLRFYDNGNCHFRASVSGYFGTNDWNNTHLYNNYILFNISTGIIANNNYFGIGETINNAPVIYGGIEFSIDRSVVANPLTAAYSAWINGNSFILKYSNTSSSQTIRIYRLFKPSEILTHARLTTCYDPSNTFDFNANKYIPKFDENDKFLNEWVSGTFEEIEDDLRPWQYETIRSNTLDPDDIPPYSPTPGDDSADSSGDDIRPWDFVNTPLSAANNFVTLYALTTSQVSEFGATMWAKLSDTAFWQSVGTVFLNDFSINPADMLKYFISLRYFPFDLSNYSATYANGIYIGRSTYPIQISTYPRRMQRNLVEINGGSVTVILPSPFNTNDFRNCDPATKVTAYVPYCGIVELSASEVYGKTLYLTYFVDMQTGSISASICVQSNTYYEIATLAGSCGAEVPITANNNIEFLQRIATVASGALSNTISGAAQGAQIGGAPGAVAGGMLGALTGSTQALAALPPVTVHKAGKATGFATLGGSYRAHISIQVAKSDIPDSYAHTTGYISNKKARIGDLTGYTEMINPDVTGIDAHADELEKIKAILTTGFYA